MFYSHYHRLLFLSLLQNLFSPTNRDVKADTKKVGVCINTHNFAVITCIRPVDATTVDPYAKQRWSATIVNCHLMAALLNMNVK